MERTTPLLLLILVGACTMAQTPYPPTVVQNVQWADGSHHVGVTQPILSPSSAGHPVAISGTAKAEFVSAASVRLAEGFHAGSFSGNGSFHAWIDESTDPAADIVLIAPEPATHISGNTLHVNQWEKLEIGLRLPYEYQAAIDRFFDHYYGDPNDPYLATPGNVDPLHDLNPYADDSLQLIMTLTRPDQSQILRWGFFMREAKWSDASDTSILVENSTSLLYPYHIRFRLAPEQVGEWEYTITLRAPQTRTPQNDPLPDLHYTGFAFKCEPPLPDNHGPLKVNTNNRRTLKFEDDTPFFGLGTNLAGKPSSLWTYVRGDYDTIRMALEQLNSVGANFCRVFMMRSIFAVEWVNLGVYDKYSTPNTCFQDGSLHYTGNCQHLSWTLDQIVDDLREQGIYVQLCIDPYPPIGAYQTFIWYPHAYVLNYLERARDTTTGRYDTNEFFYKEGNPTNTDDGVFYYWKRKYKYIMSRWGYSVNIPIIEPFNEVNQMLGYRYRDQTVTGGHELYDICPQDRIYWPADPTVPHTYNQWLTDIITYVKGEQDFSDPVHSPLGHGDKLFLTGTGPEDNDNPNWENPTNPNWNLPNTNPNVDLVDVHHGMYWGEGELSTSFSHSQAIRDAYTSSTDGTKRPFHQGESNYYQYVDINPNDTIEDWKDAALYFDNYDVSFHNEIWASTFFGNFAAATTWQKERVFWWGHKMPVPLPDPDNPFQSQYLPTAILRGINALKVPTDSMPLLVENRALYHHFKPLSSFLEEVAINPGGFFDQLHTPRKVYDDVSGLECYFLTNADSTMAIGWVHNLNAYWEKHYYVKNNTAMQNYLGCTPPNAQVISLPSLQADIDYRVSWYPTRMNMTALPATLEDSTRTGTITLDLASLPFNGIFSWPENDNLDTLRSDYAFLIEPLPEPRMVPAGNEAPLLANEYDFGLYPNPTNGMVNIVLPTGPAVDLEVLDVAGRRLTRVTGLTEGVHALNLEHLVPGVYGICITSPNSRGRTKLLIKR